jgi:hypothetical protein
MYFGGSGDPDLPPAEELKPGDEVEWKYNNMVARIPLIRWIVGRLDPQKRSIAKLDTRVVDGEEVLTVVSVRLHLVFELRRLGLRLRLPSPLELELDAILAPDHFRFRQVNSLTLSRLIGLNIVSISSSAIDVTSSRGGSISITKSSGDSVSFTYSRALSNAAIEGPVVWLAHYPEDSTLPLLVGDLNLTSPAVTIPLSDFRRAPGPQGLQVEIVSLRDPQHLWASARL